MVRSPGLPPPNTGMGNYFELAEQFHTQNDPSYCGPGTIVMALNALGLDPRRMWKAPWRWFSEEMLVRIGGGGFRGGVSAGDSAQHTCSWPWPCP